VIGSVQRKCCGGMAGGKLCAVSSAGLGLREGAQ